MPPLGSLPASLLHYGAGTELSLTLLSQEPSEWSLHLLTAAAMVSITEHRQHDLEAIFRDFILCIFMFSEDKHFEEKYFTKIYKSRFLGTKEAGNNCPDTEVTK